MGLVSVGAAVGWSLMAGLMCVFCLLCRLSHPTQPRCFCTLPDPTSHPTPPHPTQPDAVVELWCCGANVPGAWLESRVKRVRNGRYCVGRVLSTGSLWVERDRLRLVKQGTWVVVDGWVVVQE